MALKILVAFIVFSSSVASLDIEKNCAICPYLFNRIAGVEGKCFHYIDLKRTFKEAVDFCKNLYVNCSKDWLFFSFPPLVKLQNKAVQKLFTRQLHVRIAV